MLFCHILYRSSVIGLASQKGDVTTQIDGEIKMEKKDWLAKHFEETRKHLKAVAYRMLGSVGEAEDAVQEAWIRLSRSESEKVENLSGWLTTVVARVCLDMLRSRKSRREESLDKINDNISREDSRDPEADFLLADSVGSALLVVLDTLTPAERIAFVLHDLFDLSFEEIAPIIDRTEAATRQLASRARRRIKGATIPQEYTKRQQQMVSAFLAASRDGNFEALLTILHPDIVLRVDETAVKVSEANKSRGAPNFRPEIKGAKNVFETFKGKAEEAQLALIDGLAGATWAPGGRPVVAFCFSFTGGKITAIDIVMDPKKLREIDIEIVASDNASHV